MTGGTSSTGPSGDLDCHRHALGDLTHQGGEGPRDAPPPSATSCSGFSAQKHASAARNSPGPRWWTQRQERGAKVPVRLRQAEHATFLDACVSRLAVACHLQVLTRIANRVATVRLLQLMPEGPQRPGGDVVPPGEQPSASAAACANNSRLPFSHASAAWVAPSSAVAAARTASMSP